MIEALRSDELMDMCGGKFKLTALIQRRWLQLLQGARPMVESKGLTEIEVVIREILDGKIEFEMPESTAPEEPEP